MLTKSTISVASQLAASLTERGILLSLKEGAQTPVSVMANHYAIGAPGLRRELNDAAYRKLNENLYKHINVEGIELAAEQRDELVELIATGQKKFLQRVRQEIIPKCKKVKETIQNVVTTKLPEIEIKKVSFCPLLDDPALVEHLSEYPRRHVMASQYRSVNLTTPDAETIIEWAKQTKHFDGDVVGKWLLEHLTTEDIRCVFGELFNERLVFAPNELSFTRQSRLFSSSNELVLAYFLTAYLRDNPGTPTGQSMSLDEWEALFDKLHGFFGLRLVEHMKIRQAYRKMERIVDEYVYSDMSKGGGYLFVHVNPDVYPEWIAKSNSVKTLLGAGANGDHTTVTARDFEGSEERLERLWERKHALIRSRKAVSNLATIRTSIAHAITEEFGNQRDKRDEVTALLSRKNDSQLDDVWGTIFDVVCSVYYPSPMYRRFLSFLQHYSAMDKDNREAALLANTEVMALQLRSMVTYDKVTFDIVEPTGETA